MARLKRVHSKWLLGLVGTAVAAAFTFAVLPDHADDAVVVKGLTPHQRGQASRTLSNDMREFSTLLPRRTGSAAPATSKMGRGAMEALLGRRLTEGENFILADVSNRYWTLEEQPAGSGRVVATLLGTQVGEFDPQTGASVDSDLLADRIVANKAGLASPP